MQLSHQRKKVNVLKPLRKIKRHVLVHVCKHGGQINVRIIANFVRSNVMQIVAILVYLSEQEKTVAFTKKTHLPPITVIRLQPPEKSSNHVVCPNILQHAVMQIIVAQPAALLHSPCIRKRSQPDANSEKKEQERGKKYSPMPRSVSHQHKSCNVKEHVCSKAENLKQDRQSEHAVSLKLGSQFPIFLGQMVLRLLNNHDILLCVLC
jgi:hypothetical protein